MESLIRLNIKSTALKQRYYEKRSSEILKISVAIWILTVLFNISSTLTDIYSGTYSFQFLLASYICLAVHFSLILLTKRFPTQLCFLHSPVLVLLMVPCMLWYNPGSVEDIALNMLPTISALFITLLCGFMTNACWMLTSCSLVIAASTLFTFFYLVYGFYNVVCTLEVVLTIGMMAVQLYRTELVDKRDFLNYS